MTIPKKQHDISVKTFLDTAVQNGITGKFDKFSTKLRGGGE